MLLDNAWDSHSGGTWIDSICRPTWLDVSWFSPIYKGWINTYHSAYKQVRVLVALDLVAAYARSKFIQLRKSAAEGRYKMKAWNSEVHWYCPTEQRLMANDIRELGERQQCYPFDYSGGLHIQDGLKGVDRQRIALELIFYFINMPFRALQVDKLTSKIW